MTIRRFNFTGRKRVDREHVKIELAQGADGATVFSAHVDLAGYGLPGAASVFIEAVRQTSWMRFDCGTVAELKAPRDEVLSEFGTGAGVRFRLKVVSADSGAGSRRLILAHADGIRPKLPETDKGTGESLLPIEWGEFRDRVWRLEFGEDTEPIMRLSRQIVPDRDALVGSPEFVSLVLPEVLSCILGQVLRVEQYGATEDDDNWRSQWLKLAVSFPGAGGVPSPADQDACDEWIDAVVAAFSRHNAISDEFGKWWSEVGGV